MRLTTEEAGLLLPRVAPCSASWATTTSGPLLSALAKLTSALDDPAAFDIRLGDASEETMAMLRTAIAEHRQVHIDYYSYGRDLRTRAHDRPGTVLLGRRPLVRRRLLPPRGCRPRLSRRSHPQGNAARHDVRPADRPSGPAAPRSGGRATQRDDRRRSGRALGARPVSARRKRIARRRVDSTAVAGRRTVRGSNACSYGWGPTSVSWMRRKTSGLPGETLLRHVSSLDTADDAWQNHAKTSPRRSPVNDTPPEGSPGLDDPQWVDKILAAHVSARAPRTRRRRASDTPCGSTHRRSQPAPVTTSFATTGSAPFASEPAPTAATQPDRDAIDQRWSRLRRYRARSRSRGRVRRFVAGMDRVDRGRRRRGGRRAADPGVRCCRRSTSRPSRWNRRCTRTTASWSTSSATSLHDVTAAISSCSRSRPTMASSEINDLIKRVIALPGETIEFTRRRRSTSTTRAHRAIPRGRNDPRSISGWVTGCANPVVRTDQVSCAARSRVRDGRQPTHSSDSRVFGPIDEDLIVGRAFVTLWPPSKLGFSVADAHHARKNRAIGRSCGRCGR